MADIESQIGAYNNENIFFNKNSLIAFPTESLTKPIFYLIYSFFNFIQVLQS